MNHEKFDKTKGEGFRLKPRVLHVDDSEDYLELFHLIYIDRFQITSANRVKKALEILEQEHFDAVVTDYDMPEMTGLDLLKNVKNKYPHLPVIFYTGQGNEAVAREAFITGVSDYFVKEFDSLAHKEKLANSVITSIEKKKAENRLYQLNQTLTKLGSDYTENVDIIIKTCGTLLNADNAIYNRVTRNKAHVIGMCCTPPDFPTEFYAEKTLCGDLIIRGRQGEKGVFVVKNLPETPYYTENSVIARYGYNSYVGQPVFCMGKCIGSICIFYKSDKDVDENEKRILEIMAKSLGLEEDRRVTANQIRHLNLVLKSIRNINQLIVEEKSKDNLIEKACDSLITSRGYTAAWIALFDEKTNQLTVRHSGMGEDFNLKNDCVLGKHLEAGKIEFISNIGDVCQGINIPEEIKNKSGIFTHLNHGNRVFGILFVALPGDIVFNQDEKSLFLEVAGDIAYALYNIEVEEKRILAEKSLKYRLKIEQMITSISKKFIRIKPDEIDDAIKDSLKQIGIFADADRSYIFLVSEDKKKISINMEWHKPEIMSKIDMLQNIPIQAIPWWMGKISNNESVYIDNPDDLPAEAENEKQFLHLQQIKNLILVPMVQDSETLGFLGFDSTRSYMNWPQEDLSLLRIVAEIFVKVLFSKQMQAALMESEEKYRIIADSIQEGIFTIDNYGKFTFVNDVCLKMAGYRKDEVIGHNFKEFIPEEYWDMMKNAIRRKVVDKNTIVCELEFMTKTGSLVPAVINISRLPEQSGKMMERVGILRVKKSTAHLI